MYIQHLFFTNKIISLQSHLLITINKNYIFIKLITFEI